MAYQVDKRASVKQISNLDFTSWVVNAGARFGFPLKLANFSGTSVQRFGILPFLELHSGQSHRCVTMAHAAGKVGLRISQEKSVQVASCCHSEATSFELSFTHEFDLGLSELVGWLGGACRAWEQVC